MRILDSKEVLVPKQVIAENESDGHLVCACGHEYVYDLTGDVNRGEWFGYIVPICPECDCIPHSDTRRMDL